jgi:Flp pilus assembly protein TadB
MMGMLLLEESSDNFVLWISLILCSLGCLVIWKGSNNKKK